MGIHHPCVWDQWGEEALSCPFLPENLPTNLKSSFHFNPVYQLGPLTPRFVTHFEALPIPDPRQWPLFVGAPLMLPPRRDVAPAPLCPGVSRLGSVITAAVYACLHTGLVLNALGSPWHVFQIPKLSSLTFNLLLLFLIMKKKTDPNFLLPSFFICSTSSRFLLIFSWESSRSSLLVFPPSPPCLWFGTSCAVPIEQYRHFYPPTVRSRVWFRGQLVVASLALGRDIMPVLMMIFGNPTKQWK